MPEKIERDGQEMTVYSEEELEEAKNTAIEENDQGRVQEIDTLKSELDQKTRDLEKAAEDLKKAGNKGQNIDNLRDVNDKLTNDIKDLTGKLGDVINKVKVIDDTTLATEMDKLSGGDAELNKKIKVHFEKTLESVKATNLDEIRAKMQQAYLLATGSQVQQGNIRTAPGGGAPRFNISGGGNGKTPIKPELKEMMKKNVKINGISLTDEDFEKYDKQDFSATE